MMKWGVRLISFCFGLWAVSTIVRIILNPSDAGGFFGIYIDFSIKIYPYLTFPQVDFNAWGEVCVLLLIGYYLLRFNPTARSVALIILWPSVLWNGLLFLWSFIAVFFARSSSEMYMALHPFGTEWKFIGLDVPLFTGSSFILEILPIYLLMRKDVKMEFQKQEVPEPKPATE